MSVISPRHKSPPCLSPIGRFWSGRSWLLALLLGAAAFLVGSGCLWLQLPGLGREAAAPDPTGAGMYQLSPSQSDLLRQRGHPQAFTLLFYEQLGVDGASLTVRQETWDYYSQGESYTFVNGELDSFDSIEAVDLASLAAQPYSPEQFAAKMSLDDVLAAADVEEFIEVPLEEQFLDGGDLYYGRALAFGMIDGKLRYLEALAVLEE